ncbi:MAG: RluA family pseudouridine synthase [Oligoflexus sp.]
MAHKEGDGGELSIVVDTPVGSERIDLFLSRYLQDESRSTIQKWIRAGQCSINGEICKARDTVTNGDVIRLNQQNEVKPPLFLSPRPLPLDILYEDQDVLVVNKQADVVVHPGAGTIEPTLIEGILFYLQKKAEDLPGSADRPGIVHRLDKDTTGAIVICKTLAAHEHLSRQFREKSNLREYVALLDGVLTQPELVVESYLTRDERNRLRQKSVTIEEYNILLAEGKKVDGLRFAKTSFYRKAVYQQRLTLVAAELATGRTHQIRVHAQSIRHPVWGDPLYSRHTALSESFPSAVSAMLRGVKRQMLHARKLGFRHPTTGEELAFVAPLPEDFRKVLEILNDSGQVIRS